MPDRTFGSAQAKWTAILEQIQQLHAQGRPYLLFGVGRWGSRDPWLGIPVTWERYLAAQAA